MSLRAKAERTEAVKKKRARSGPKVDTSRHPLAEWRERERLTIGALAKLASVDAMTISRIERGEQLPGPKAAKALALVIMKRSPKRDPRRVMFSLDVVLKGESSPPTEKGGLPTTPNEELSE